MQHPARERQTPRACVILSARDRSRIPGSLAARPGSLVDSPGSFVARPGSFAGRRD